MTENKLLMPASVHPYNIVFPKGRCEATDGAQSFTALQDITTISFLLSTFT